MFKKIFIRRNRNLSIQRFDPNNSNSVTIEKVENKLVTLDKELKELTGGLLQAQVVRIRSGLDSRKGFVGTIQKNVYRKAANEAVGWHSKQISILIKERYQVEEKLDRLKGVFWYKRIKKLLSLLLLVAIGVVLTWIAILGLITAIYILPIILSILALYFIVKKQLK